MNWSKTDEEDEIKTKKPESKREWIRWICSQQQISSIQNKQLKQLKKNLNATSKVKSIQTNNEDKKRERSRDKHMYVSLTEK